MEQEKEYVDYFYDKYTGRIPLGVAYNQNLSEIYPFVYIDKEGDSIGIVAIDTVAHENVNAVHLYHLSVFTHKIGNGSLILRELCCQADRYRVVLSVSPVFMTNGRDARMSDKKLESWYETFGFIGHPQLRRVPGK